MYKIMHFILKKTLFHCKINMVIVMDNKISRKEAKEMLKKKQNETKKVAKKTIENYKSFAMKGNIIDMAIGVVIGSAFTNIVNTLVSSTITPIISLLTKDVDLSTLFITLKGGHFNTIEEAKAAGAIILSYGDLLNAIINFLIISIVLFVAISIIKRSNKKEKTQEDEIKQNTTKVCPYCISTIPIEAKKCAFCTSDLTSKDNNN